VALEFKKATRKAVPMLISLSGVSGSGKTYSGLLMAAGIAGEKGVVGFLDTENGRGEMYADSPGIRKALPNGYVYARIDPPFGPDKYIEAIKDAEQAGISVLCIDSASHEWEGIGGCQEIAEKNRLRGMPNWSMAKMAHKRFMNCLLSTPMHIIVCLRAREKVKLVDVEKNGKKTTEVVPIGIQPIAEKSFVFEMLVSLRIEEESHLAVPVKVPEPLADVFPGSKKLTAQDGARIREWNDTGSSADPFEQIVKRARAAAENGMAEYAAYFESLTPQQRRRLSDSGEHAENKKTAEQADKQPEDEDSDEAIRRQNAEMLQKEQQIA
jgi:hypothetical protein